MVSEVGRYSFTVDEFAKMGEVGIFTEDDRVELIDGQIWEMAAISPLHAGIVTRLTVTLIELLGRSAVVHVQNPLRLDLHNETLPDISILKARDDYYNTAHPEPGDTLLVIEVADSSLAYDLHEKAPRYAKSMIPEMWLVDLEAEVVRVSHGRGLRDTRMSARCPGAQRLLPKASRSCASRSTRSSASPTPE